MKDRFSIAVLGYVMLVGAVSAGNRKAMTLGEPEVVWRSSECIESTDLVRYRGRMICLLQTSLGLQVIGSDEGREWRQLSRIAPVDQVRAYQDAVLTVTTDSRLMLNAVVPEPQGGGHSKVWFSCDGITWMEPLEAAESHYFVCDVTWHAGVAYHLQRGSCCGNQPVLRLGISHDHGRTFLIQTEDPEFSARGRAALMFSQDDAFCIATRHAGKSGVEGVVGTSEAPFWDWKWKKLNERIDRPSALRAPNGSLLVAGGKRGESGGFDLIISELDPQTLELGGPLMIPRDSKGPGSVSLLRDNGKVVICFHDRSGAESTVSLATVRWAGE